MKRLLAKHMNQLRIIIFLTNKTKTKTPTDKNVQSSALKSEGVSVSCAAVLAGAPCCILVSAHNTSGFAQDMLLLLPEHVPYLISQSSSEGGTVPRSPPKNLVADKISLVSI